jgi:hypothetical protein
MFTMCDVYSVHLVWNGAADKKIFKKEEVQLTVSSTMPIWLNVAYSIGWNERKRKQN